MDITSQYSVLKYKLLRDNLDVQVAVSQAFAMGINGHVPVGDRIKRWLKWCFDNVKEAEAKAIRLGLKSAVDAAVQDNAQERLTASHYCRRPVAEHI